MDPDRRLTDLLISRATEGLSLADSDELQRRLTETPDPTAVEIELAAAAADLAFQGDRPLAPLPAALRRRLKRRILRRFPS